MADDLGADIDDNDPKVLQLGEMGFPASQVKVALAVARLVTADDLQCALSILMGEISPDDIREQHRNEQARRQREEQQAQAEAKRRREKDEKKTIDRQTQRALLVKQGDDDHALSDELYVSIVGEKVGCRWGLNSDLPRHSGRC